MDFDYKEDEFYFEQLLASNGGLKDNLDLFDSTPPDIKRKEFNKIRNTVFQLLIELYGDSCQLQCHEDCSGIATQVDHLIPLSSNVLNKELRSMKGGKGRKAPTQSFGSNHETNFVLACQRCNAYKKHRLPTNEMLENVKEARFKE